MDLYICKQLLLLCHLLSALLLCPAAAQQDGALSPPITFTTNFASMTAVDATSTCTACSGGVACLATSCNDTCPFGQELPSPIDLLDIGVLSAGVERVCYAILIIS